jgi:hypothetical protein
MNEASIRQQNVYTQVCCIKHIISIYGGHTSNGGRQTGCREGVVSVKAMALVIWQQHSQIRIAVGTVSSLHSPPLELLTLLCQCLFLGMRAAFLRMLWNWLPDTVIPVDTLPRS